MIIGQTSPVSQDEPMTTLYTVGHSTRSAQEFQELLTAYDIELVVDVRRFPGSRRLPHFTADSFERDLAVAGFSYMWLPALGGRRRGTPGAPVNAWRHPAFRAYADYLTSEEFAVGLTELLSLSIGMRTVIVCAELLWWRCHRRLISDVFVSIGIPVVHIRSADFSEPHRLTEPARLVRGMLTYSD